MVPILRLVPTAGISLVFLSACAGQNTTGAGSFPSVTQNGHVATTPLRSASRPASANTTLYVLNEPFGGSPSVSVYSRLGAKYLRTVPSTGGDAFTADSAGKLYLSQSANLRSYTLNVYTNNGAKIERTMKEQNRSYNSLAVDSAENLYTGCGPGQQLCEFAKKKLLRKLSAFGPVATDSADNVAAFQYSRTSVGVYAPGQTSPYWTATGLDQYVAALAFDSSGNLYVMDNNNNAHGTGYVAVYAPNASVPALKITNGVDVPMGIAIDSANNLYVLNTNQSGSSISVYAQGQATPFETITDGVTGSLPVAGMGSPITIDSANNLYVTNYYKNSVTVYASGSVHPSMTITKGLNTPRAVAI